MAEKRVIICPGKSKDDGARAKCGNTQPHPAHPMSQG
jgi:hypothetical protein